MERSDEHPAGPSQPDEGGFEEGAERIPEERSDYGRGHDDEHAGTDEGLQPDFARGIDAEHPHNEAEGRYSRGSEDPATEAASEEGRFSEGVEQLPHERE